MKSSHQKEYNMWWMKAERSAHNLKEGYKSKFWENQAKIRLEESVKKLNEITIQKHIPARKHEWWNTGKITVRHTFPSKKKTWASRIASRLSHFLYD